jgi:cysteine-rich repeat protein
MVVKTQARLSRLALFFPQGEHMRTSRTFAKTLAGVVVALAVTHAGFACDVFDASLYQSQVILPISDRCEQDVPVIGSSGTPFFIDTAGMAADYHDFAGCARRELPGNDGFVRIETNPGEKWHVHVEPLERGLDPAIYVLPNCDVRSCLTRATNDGCGTDKAEHLSFVSATGGAYLVGVDSRLPGGGRFSVIVTQPICGNGGQPEHSEACDDGNTVSGDRCDSQCRVELMGTTVTEDESNEMPSEANVLLDGPLTTINGTIGNHCGDVDVFAVQVGPAGEVRAQLLSRAGSCAGAPTRLTLLAPDGVLEIGTVASEGDVGPTIDQRHAFARGLAAGVYYVRASSLAADPFEYQLKLERR